MGTSSVDSISYIYTYIYIYIYVCLQLYNYITHTTELLKNTGLIPPTDREQGLCYLPSLCRSLPDVGRENLIRIQSSSAGLVGYTVGSMALNYSSNLVFIIIIFATVHIPGKDGGFLISLGH